MKLKRLVLQGFKSFRDKTTINFDEGITGIVGPNGCGKSNIVDALFWVMGEMSAKHLRGQSMKDLIFAGSAKFNPSSYAEASLVLENEEKKHIHIGGKVTRPEEIQLTRKLYKNGETEYRINGMPARLKDIQEVFMDTGAGAKSYSIIAQGEINKLVQAKPIDRRAMIEDVAGITKFKMRRKESLRKIDLTKENLARLNDLQAEIYKQLKVLEDQAQKANRAKSLKEKIKRNEMIVASHQEFDLLTDIRELSKRNISFKEELEGYIASKNTIELDIEKQKIVRTEIGEKLEEKQKEFNEFSKELAAAEERLTHLKKSNEEKEKTSQSRSIEQQRNLEDLEKNNQKIADLNQELKNLQEENSKEFNFDELEKEVNDLKVKFDLVEVDKRELENFIKDSEKKISELEQEDFRVSSKLQECNKNFDDVNFEIEEIEKRYSKFINEVEKLKAEISEKEEIVSKSEEKVNLLKSQLEENTRLEKESRKERNELDQKHIKLSSKVESLEELNRTLEGSRSGINEFLENNNEDYSLLGQLIEANESYSKAIQSLFSNDLSVLIAASSTAELYSWSVQNETKGLELIKPVASEMFANEMLEDAKKRLEILGCLGVTSVVDQIKVKDLRFQKSVTNLFSGYFLVENLSAEIVSQMPEDLSVKGLVSYCGRYVYLKEHNSYRFINCGEIENQIGVIERNNIIKEGKAELENLSAELERVTENHKTYLESVDTIKAEYDDVLKNFNSDKSELSSLKGTFNEKSRFTNQDDGKLKRLKERLQENSKLKFELVEKEEQIKKELKKLKELGEGTEEKYEEVTKNYLEIESQYKEKNDFYVQKQVDIKTFKERELGVSKQIENISEFLVSSEKRKEELEAEIEKLLLEITENKEVIAKLDSENQEKASTLKEKESNLRVEKSNYDQLISSIQKLEDTNKKNVNHISRIEKDLVKIEQKLLSNIEEEEQVVKNTFEKHQIDLRDTLCRNLEYTENEKSVLADISSMYFFGEEDETVEIQKVPYDFVRRYGQDLRSCAGKLRNYKTELNKLGDINWKAVEEYDRQKVRHDFLGSQEEELKTSLTDLEEAINHIDEKSRARFKMAFEEVDMRFKKVFPIIFGGGSACLRLSGHVDDPECGVEIIAQPPGKKMQNINLMSGGEKAMTAVSLIFSIFLVKPSPFCLLDEVDAPLDDANVGRFNELLREMSSETQFILITHNKKTMELNDTLYGITMQDPGISKAVSVQVH